MEQGLATPPPDPLTCAGLEQRLQSVRVRQNLTRRGLARSAKTSDTTIRLIEEGRQVPRVDLAEKIARALDVSPCWLAYGVMQGPEK